MPVPAVYPPEGGGGALAVEDGGGGAMVGLSASVSFSSFSSLELGNDFPAFSAASCSLFSRSISSLLFTRGILEGFLSDVRKLTSPYHLKQYLQICSPVNLNSSIKDSAVILSIDGGSTL